MPRPEKPRTIGNHSEESMKQALHSIQGGMSVRKASKIFNIPFTTLRRYFNKFKSFGSMETMRLIPNYEVRKVFDNKQEESLKEYYKYCSSIFYGLSEKECRRVAYQMAEKNNIKMPDNWVNNQIAGKEWFRKFRQRHKDLSLRKPEPCSLARATAFNRTNVEIFYKNLESLLQRFPAFNDGTRIFYLDLTSTTTVQKPQRVIAPKGRRNVGKVTSGERGTLVTTCCIISAGGIALPPVMVFPRKNFKSYMTKNTPPGTLGLAAPSGWMNTDIFPDVIKHFIKNTNSTVENPTLLILDNHESHLSLNALDLAKTSGVHILTLHPHTSAKLQPLDVGIYGPFKSHYNAAIDSWMLRNPGKPITIYEIGDIVGVAFLKVMTPVNIINSFKKCGIYPFDRNLFTDDDFMPSSVTDRPYPDDEEQRPSQIVMSSVVAGTDQTHIRDEAYANAVQRIQRVQSDDTVCSKSDEDLVPIDATTIHIPANEDGDTSGQSTTLQINAEREGSPSILDSVSQDDFAGTVLQIEPEVTPGTSYMSALLEHPSSPAITPKTPEKSHVPLSLISTNNVSFISPFVFRDPIKAGPRKSIRKPRKLGRSMIATDTPEKTMIELAKAKTTRQRDIKRKKIVKKVLQDDSDEENDEAVVQYQESDEDSEWLEEDVDMEIAAITERDLKRPLLRTPMEGEYVLVEFSTKKQKLFYIGKVLESRNEHMEYYISFLRKKTPGKFYMPTVPDLSLVKEADIKSILPKPSVGGSTTRQQSYYYFSIDLSQLNVQ